jgi:hypothetical protein
MYQLRSKLGRRFPEARAGVEEAFRCGARPHGELPMHRILE